MIDLGFISPYTNLSFGQTNTFKNILGSTFQVQYGNNVMNFSNNIGAFNYQLDYVNPGNTIYSFGRQLGISNAVIPLIDEATKTPDKEGFLKRCMNWLAKNWKAILTGFISVYTFIQAEKNGQLYGGNNYGGVDYSNYTGAGGGTDVFNPTGGTPYNPYTPTPGGVNIGKLITDNIIPIGIVAAVLIFSKKGKLF
jgi:hypothetical protein